MMGVADVCIQLPLAALPRHRGRDDKIYEEDEGFLNKITLPTYQALGDPIKLGGFDLELY